MSARRLTVSSLVSLCAVVGLMLLCSPSVFAARGHVFGGTFGEPCSGEPCGKGQFKEPGQVAVNESTGDVYVIDGGDQRVEWFTSSGAYLGQFDGSGSFEVGGKVEAGMAAGGGGKAGEIPTGMFAHPAGIAVDNACVLHSPVLTEATTPTCHEFDPSAGDVYLYDGGSHEVIDKFSATGEYVGQLTTTPTERFERIVGVSVDSRGLVWIDRNMGAFDGEIYSFSNVNPNGFLSERALLKGVSESFSVDFNESFYYFYLSLLEGAERYTSFGNGIKLYNGKGSLEESGNVSPLIEFIGEGEREPAYALAVDPVRHEVYTYSQENFVTRFAENRSSVEQFGAGYVSSGGSSGIGVDSSSEEVFVANSVADVVDMFPPQPPSAPKIVDQAVSFVTSGSATFSASINPGDFATEYRFEYGPTASYGQSVPVSDAMVGSGFELNEVTSHAQDLEADTTYHYRVVAHNSDGTTYAEDRTFTTQRSGGALKLPDGRVWEMVTPAEKQGALFEADNERGNGLGVSVQASVNGDAIVDLASQPTEVEPQGYAGEVSVLSTRGSAGWSSQVIAAPHKGVVGVLIGAGVEYRFFSEDLTSGLLQPFGREFTQLSPEATQITPYVHSDYLNGDVSEHCEVSCFRPLVTGGDTSPDAPFGKCEGATVVVCGPEFLDATPDLAHVILASLVQLTPKPVTGEGLYEWSDERLQLVNILPTGEEGSARLATPSSRINDNPGFDLSHAISGNGERIVLTTGSGLYLRDVVKGETVRLDVVQGGSTGSAKPQFVTANNDDSRIFFFDEGRLTVDSSPSGRDLYEYDIDAPSGSRLTDLTLGSGEPARIQTVFGASEDGSYVYFAAGSVLAPGAVPDKCTGRATTCNLYVWHSGETKLVAANVNDSEEFAAGGLASVSSDGRWFAFMSESDLTGYDTHDAVSGQLDTEVYLYDASAGKLVCASCDPTGARPVGVQGIAGKWYASNVPGWTQIKGGDPIRQPRYLSDSGRLFFDSTDALVSQDVNGTLDAYEYEPAGVGDCSTSNVGFAVRVDGCVGLLSSGSSTQESMFLDASGTGGDVFFLTTSKLVSQDFDRALDVYDAHECTSEAPCYPAPPVSPPVCSTGDSCKASPSPQPSIFGPTPSATFTGAGNVIGSSGLKKVVVSKSLTRSQKLARALRVCHKRAGKKRAVCERNARKRYGPSKGSSKTNANKKGKR